MGSSESPGDCRSCRVASSIHRSGVRRLFRRHYISVLLLCSSLVAIVYHGNIINPTKHLEAFPAPQFIKDTTSGSFKSGKLRDKTSDQINICSPYKRHFNCCNPITALASFPGSGNHWLRYLLEEATGNIWPMIHTLHAAFFCVN